MKKISLSHCLIKDNTNGKGNQIGAHTLGFQYRALERDLSHVASREGKMRELRYEVRNFVSSIQRIDISPSIDILEDVFV
jgi:hypothetical protein